MTSSRIAPRPLTVSLFAAVAILVPLAAAGASSGHAPPLPSPIQHVVIISKENRSFDSYFGQFPGADGATTAMKSDGTVVPLVDTPEPFPNDIGHANGDFVRAYDDGKMDGFDREVDAYSQTGIPLALTQKAQSGIPNYWA